MTYTEAAFERLSCHDRHIWAVEGRPGDPDEGGSPEAIETIPMSLTERCPRSDRASRDVAGIGEVEGHPTDDHLRAPVGTPWHCRGCNWPFNLVRLGPRGPKRP
jgi:hypothetical protein